jgi:putative oxidoreductase
MIAEQSLVRPGKHRMRQSTSRSRNLLLETHPALLDLSILLLRLTLGWILFMSGSGKVLRWFGGFGLATTVQFMAKVGISAPWAYVSSYTEFIGGFLLIVGLLTRLTAIPVTINMIVATIVSLPRGFLTGAAFPLALMICAIVILLTGPRAYSLDALLFRGLDDPHLTPPK